MHESACLSHLLTGLHAFMRARPTEPQCAHSVDLDRPTTLHACEHCGNCLLLQTMTRCGLVGVELALMNEQHTSCCMHMCFLSSDNIVAATGEH